VTRLSLLIWLCWCLVFTSAGCATFPKKPDPSSNGLTRCWMTTRSGQYDYFQYLDAGGKITALGYDDNRDGVPETRIDFIAMGQNTQSPHYFILLDGIPYSLVERMYREGHFRLFYSPAKLVSCFPSMTDLAYSEMLCPGQPCGWEASYYNRSTNCLSDGNKVYLTAGNAPWEKCLEYRVSMILDPVGYISPGLIFNQDMSGMERTMERKKSGTVQMYSIGTATVGTRKGEEGFIDCLKRVDELCEKIVHDRRGRCRITILADHGHNLTPATFFDIADVLKNNGFNVTNKVKDSDDVVCIQFGLVTYNAMYTQDPEKVATVLLDQEPVELAVYPIYPKEGMKIVVRDKQGMAMVDCEKGKYRYEMKNGDPLKLAPTLKSLKEQGKIDQAGFIDADALFMATIDNEYPDPLHRIWRGFNGLARNPPDLAVTIKDSWFCGNPSFARSIKVASTHGSLNKMNSVTFIMSTTKPVAVPIRLQEVRQVFPEFQCE